MQWGGCQVPMVSLSNTVANPIIEGATVTRVTAFPVGEGESWMSMLQQPGGLSWFSLPKNVKSNIPWRRQMSTSPR